MSGLSLVASSLYSFRGSPPNYPFLPHDLFSSNFDVFLCAFFGVPKHRFSQKVPKSDPKREPKGDQKPPKWRMSDLSKHMVFSIYHTDHTFCHFGRAPGAFFFYTVFRTLFFNDLFAIFEILVPKRPPKRTGILGGKCLKIRPRRQNAPKGPQGRPRSCQMMPKWSPRVPK